MDFYIQLMLDFQGIRDVFRMRSLSYYTHNPDLQLTAGANPVFLADGPLRFATGKAIANSRFLEFGRVSSPSPVGEGLRSATLIVAKPSTEELGRDTGRLRQGLDASFSTVVSLNEVNLYFCRYPFFVHKMPPIR